MLKEDYGAECKLVSTHFPDTQHSAKTNSSKVHEAVYDFQLERRSRPRTTQDNHDLPDLRPPQELLSELHARSVLWPAHCRA